LLEPGKLIDLSSQDLADLIRPSGFFNQKTKKIKSFLEFFDSSYQFSIEKMKKQDPTQLRQELLDVFGIGEETADCILLYALDKPFFVIDKYTRRIYGRLGLIDPKISYSELSSYFMRNIPEDIPVYKGYHKLIIYHGREFCSASNPGCETCILREYCSH
ncbi:MAG: endonuclease, partial [bacterium]|nr:endonuclease [bacterium]